MVKSGTSVEAHIAIVTVNRDILTLERYIKDILADNVVRFVSFIRNNLMVMHDETHPSLQIGVNIVPNGKHFFELVVD